MTIPTLHNGPVQFAETPQDIVAYLIRHSLKNPGFTSSIIEDQLVSFRKLEAKFVNRDDLIEAYMTKLQEVIDKNLPGAGVNVSIDWESKEGTNDYTLIITVTANDMVILSYNKILVTKNDIIINFDKKM